MVMSGVGIKDREEFEYYLKSKGYEIEGDKAYGLNTEGERVLECNIKYSEINGYYTDGNNLRDINKEFAEKAKLHNPSVSDVKYGYKPNGKETRLMTRDEIMANPSLNKNEDLFKCVKNTAWMYKPYIEDITKVPDDKVVFGFGFDKHYYTDDECINTKNIYTKKELEVACVRHGKGLVDLPLLWEKLEDGVHPSSTVHDIVRKIEAEKGIIHKPFEIPEGMHYYALNYVIGEGQIGSVLVESKLDIERCFDEEILDDALRNGLIDKDIKENIINISVYPYTQYMKMKELVAEKCEELDGIDR